MSFDIVRIEERLSTVEAELRQVQRKLSLVPPAANWVEGIAGSLADLPESDFQQFLDHCRSVRAGDSFREGASKSPRF